MLRVTSLFGLILLVGVAWALSENRRAISWRFVGWGLGLQFVIGVLLLLTPLERPVFAGMAKVVDVLTAATLAGAGFVFGKLADFSASGSMLAFQVLPVIIFVSALSSLLYYLRVIPVVVQGVAWCMRRTLKTSGAETLGTALLIFMGIESLTAVRAYMRNMTRSELCTLMTAFMGTIAGSVLIIYANFGVQPGHLLAASLMSAPASIMFAKLLVPETETPETSGDTRAKVEITSRNMFDALTDGATLGLQVALQVGALLIVFVGLVYLLNALCGAVTGYTFTDLMGIAFRPVAFFLGVPLKDVAAVGNLLGTKTVLNEFLAYEQLAPMISEQALTPRSITIASYALCGFANPGSIGIAIGGMAGLAPERRPEITALGVRSFIGGTLACFSTACVAGILIHV